jgi:hypothetical protein
MIDRPAGAAGHVSSPSGKKSEPDVLLHMEHIVQESRRYRLVSNKIDNLLIKCGTTPGPAALILRLRSNFVTQHRDDQKPAINFFFLVVYVRILNVACSSGACSSDDVNVASRAMDLPLTIHDETVRSV